MNNTNENDPIYIDSYDYALPNERIAKFPLQQRDTSKLLVYNNGAIIESVFSNVAAFLPEDCLLVYNNTRVIQARLRFTKSTGAGIEVFCLEPSEPADYALSLGSTQTCIWKCMVGNLKKWKSGSLVKNVRIGKKSCELQANILRSENNTHYVQFAWNDDTVHFAEILENAGELPIPPYLHRETEESDKTTYQTIYSKIEGSVAAPTAGLHFTPKVFENLKKKDIETEELTLHVGAGTFQPVKSKSINDHAMHAEIIEVNKSTIQHLIDKSGQIIAVGTTSVRTLESLHYIGLKIMQNPATKDFNISQWLPYETKETVSTSEALQSIVDYMNRNNLDSIHASTQIMIKPGYQFHVVNGMITNFHQPKSTLLLLVSAFVNGNWKKIYNYALSHDFRFLSYGDSSLLFP